MVVLPSKQFYFFFMPAFVFCGFMVAESFADSWHYPGGTQGGTLFFQTRAPDQISRTVNRRTVALPEAVDFFLTGDVEGDGRINCVGVINDPASLFVYDPLTAEFFTVPLEQNPHTIDSEFERVRCMQLVDYDNKPGLEVLCTIEVIQSIGRRSSHQVVSINQRKVLKTLYGIIGEDKDGNGYWDGKESLFSMFKSKAGKWKMFSVISATHEDYKPRAINIYDVQSSQLESQFHMATPPTVLRIHTLPDGSSLLYSVPSTPDNWIRVDGEVIHDEDGNVINVSETVDGIKMTDRESYIFMLKYDDTIPGQDPLQLQWYHRRGEYMAGYGWIAPDANGRILAFSHDYIIRQWSALEPGKVRALDIKTGEVVFEHTLDENGLSFLFSAMPENTNVFYSSLQEEARVLKFDIQEDSPVASADYASDPTVSIAILGVTDMDGDGEQDVLLLKKKANDNELIILDADLNEKKRIPVPSTYSGSVFADADRDGYPEFYYSDASIPTKLTIIEYQSGTSKVKEAYRYD